jgi:hypothetical protein
MRQSAFTTALILSYGRPFTHSNGWPKLPAYVLKMSDAQLALHFKLIKLRNQGDAHSDSAGFTTRPVHNFEGTHFDIIGVPFRKLDREDCQQVVTITTKLITNIKRKLVKLRPSVSELF